MIDGKRKAWALRYLREARAELEAAKKMPYIAKSLILEAIIKARKAIHYSLGEPPFIENLLVEAREKKKKKIDPVLNFLLEIEETAKTLEQLEEPDNAKITEQIENFLLLASNIVRTLTGE